MTDAERKARIERLRVQITRIRALKSISDVADALELIVDLLEGIKS